MGFFDWLGSGVQGVSKAFTPQNQFNAQAPVINQQNFQPGIAQSAASVQQAQGMLGQTAGQQQSVGNAQLGVAGQQQGLLPQQQQILAQQGGLAQQQQGLAQALLAQSQGQGPNPAQLQYQQNVAQAGQQAAGMIASAHGLNPALVARQAAMAQGDAQQNAAANSATLQAQQQIAAQQALGQQQQAIGQTIGAQNGTVAGMQNTYGGIGNSLGQAGNAFAGAGSAAAQIGSLGLGMQGTLQSAASAQNNALTQGGLGAQQINAGVASQNTTNNTKAAGGLLNSVGSIFGMGASAAQNAISPVSAASGAAALAHGGVVHPNLAAALLAQGGQIPGTATVHGDSPSNDTVPTMLSPGEVVLPRSVTQSPDAAEKARQFVAALKKGK
jgi:hypothetical protein